LRNPLREICTVGSVRGEILVAMVDLNAHEAGNGGQKPRDAYSLPSLLYSERSLDESEKSPQSAKYYSSAKNLLPMWCKKLSGLGLRAMW